MIPFRLLKLLFFKRNQLPLYLLHSVTERCNANCRHCFVSKKETDSEELSVKQIETLCSSIGNNLYSVCLTGGEPFLRDDLPAIIKAYLRKPSVQFVQICTNGFLTRKITETIDEIAQYDSRKTIVINFSIDGLPKVHNDIRGVPNLFEHMTKTHLALKQLSNKRNNISINFNITVSRSNEKDLDTIYNYLIHEIKTRNITTTLTRGNPRISDEKMIDLLKYKQFTKQMEQRLRYQNLPGCEDSILDHLFNAQHIVTRKRIFQTLQNNTFIAPCYAGRLSAFIDSSGNVYPCELMKESIGNIKDNEFSIIWHSDLANTLRWKVNTCFCTHENFLLINVLFNMYYMPVLFKEALHMFYNRLKAKSRRTTALRYKLIKK